MGIMNFEMKYDEELLSLINEYISDITVKNESFIDGQHDENKVPREFKLKISLKNFPELKVNAE